MKNIILTKVYCQPIPGSHIDDVKEEVKALAIKAKCKVYFNHNGDEFICDAEGNIAHLN